MVIMEKLRTPEEFADYFEERWELSQEEKDDLIEVIRQAQVNGNTQEIESTYKEIKDILLWYRLHGASSHAIDLLENRDKLAILSMRLAEIVGDAKGDYNSAYFMRIINVAREKQVQIQKKLAYNKAEVKALLDSELFYKDEMEKESSSFKNDVLLRQLNQVLSAMQQRISYANKEKINSDYTR